MTQMPETIKMKQENLKKTLLDAIFADINKNPQKALYWAEKFCNKLLPNETTIAGDKDAPLTLKYENKEELNQRIAELEGQLANVKE